MTTKLEPYKQFIETLAYSTVVSEAPKSGYTVISINDQLKVHLLISDIVDTTQEAKKQKKKEEQLKAIIEKLESAMAADDYCTKVPAEVQKQNAEKLASSKAELEQLQHSFEVLTLKESTK